MSWPGCRAALKVKKILHETVAKTLRDLTMLELSERNDIWIQSMHQFRIYFGSQDSSKRDLPWLDYERAFMIAENLHHGDDFQCVFLDLRRSTDSPRVVAPRPNTDAEFCYDWLQVADSFDEFWQRMLAADKGRS